VTRQPVCIVLTRPVWQGFEDPLVGPLRQLVQDQNAEIFGSEIRVISAPMQRLVPGDDLQACQRLEAALALVSPVAHAASSSEPGAVAGLVVATSPSSVAALTHMPQTDSQLRALLGPSDGPWAVTGVGHASAQAMVGWLVLEGQGAGRVLAFPVERGSGAQAFIQWLDETRPLHFPQAPVVLLEASDNQPTLAHALTARGFSVHRLDIYQRQPVSMPHLPCSPSDSLCVLVSSSALVEPVLTELTAQGISPKRVGWLTHHSLIAERLSARLGTQVVPVLEGLSAKEILSGLARLNFGV